MNTADVQKALKAFGFDPGPIDGVRGRKTIAAIRAFQAARKLEIDGIAGPQTMSALLGGVPVSDGGVVPLSQPWLVEALRLIGIHEDLSSQSNPLIMGWGHDLDIDYADDSVPWCGLFVAHCIGSQMTEESLPAYPLSARAWGSFGQDCSPQLGAVIVFWRGSKQGPYGHVGFYVGEDAEAYHVLGGNQSDQVSVTRIPQARFLASRWPITAPEPMGIVRQLSEAGVLSVSEQ